jgi:hypothetical protein
VNEKTTAVWLPQVLFESALIVVSILVALGLDEWRENREDAETVNQAIQYFKSEITRNRAGIDDAATFDQGLLDVLKGRFGGSEIDTVEEFVILVDSYTPVVLQSTAWETALATGSLAKMDYNLVSALSLTYSLQNRYQLATRSGLGNMTATQYLVDGKLDIAISNAIRFLTDTTQMEQELRIVYDEAESVLRRYLPATDNIEKSGFNQ